LRGRMQGVFTVVVAGGPRLRDPPAGAAAAPGRATAAWGRWGVRGPGPARACRWCSRAPPPRWSDTGRRTTPRRPDSVRCMTSAVTAKSGEQWAIESGDHRAVVVEVGGVLRSYSAGDREILDGFDEDAI